VGYLTPFYIGNKWASEPATATLAGGTVGGQFNYQQFVDPTAVPNGYATNAVGVLTQGVNPNTIAAEAAAWGRGRAAGRAAGLRLRHGGHCLADRRCIRKPDKECK
jgi:hypothetical protein